MPGTRCRGTARRRRGPLGRRTTRSTARRNRARRRAKSCRALPDRLADEEWPQAVEVLRGLLGLAHLLHDRGERMQPRAEQADDEVVVVLVETVACEPHVGRVARVAVRERAVLGEDLTLVLGRQRLEFLRALQRVPDRPDVLRVEELAQRPLEQRLLEVGLAADRVAAAEHVELGLG